MKTLLALELLALICFLHRSSAVPLAANLVTGTGCCTHLNTTIVPKARVKHVGRSSSDCSLKAIMVTTVCDKTFCFNATMKWAKDRLAEFKRAPAKFNRKPCLKAAIFI